MPGEGAQPYSRVRGANGEKYEIWVLRFSPAVFRPVLKSWRFMLPSLRWKVIVALTGGNRRRLFARVVDARFFNTHAEAVAGIDRIKTRIRSGHRPWSDAENDKPGQFEIPAIGSDAAPPSTRRKRHRSRPRPGVFVLRPRNGLPSFRRRAGYRLEDGIITATDRRGRSRSFPLDGTESAPAEFRKTGGVDGLVDGAGNMLTRSYSVDWGVVDFVDFVVAAGLQLVYADPDVPVPALRADGIEISTFNPIPTMTATSGIGVMAWRMSDWDIGPSVVTRTAMVASVLGFLGSFGFSIVTDAGDPELLEARSPRSPESKSRRQRRKTRKRRLRRRTAG